MLTTNLKSHIDRLWNKFWGGGIANPLTAIEQITYLLFMKRLDEMEAKIMTETKQTTKKYTSIFEGKYQPYGTKLKRDQRDKAELRWSYFKNMKADEMILHVQNNVFPFIKNLNGENSPFVRSMQNAVFIMPKSSLLKDAIGIIDDLYKEIESGLKGKQTFQDTQGDVYEYLLSEIATAGKMGQFRTPRHIIKLICDLLKPTISDLIADPACGTGGFLLGAYQYILTQYSTKTTIDEDGFLRGTTSDKLKDTKLRTKLNSKTFYGYDIDPSMVRIGLMNLMMHGISTPHLENKDTLSKDYNQDGIYNIVLANPPFTGSIDKADINKNFTLDTTKTELLFLERIFKMLKKGGIAGVIIPQGVLFSGGIAYKKTRQMIVEDCALKAVISMPSGVFKPYAGVATAILIFAKGEKTENVWFYEMTSDGYTLDDRRSKTKDSDLHEIIKLYHNRRLSKNTDRSGKHFFISKDEIVNKEYDLSLNKYKIEIFEPVKFAPPVEILNNLTKIEKKITTNLANLKKLLS